MGSCLVRSRDDLGYVNTEPLLHGVERDALTTLLRQLENDDAMDAQISPSQLQALYTLSFSDNRELQLSAASCYAEVSERVTGPLTVEMVKPLLHLLTVPNIEVLKSATVAVGNFALYGSGQNKAILMKACCLEPLVNLLRHYDLDVRCHACGCITSLATSEQNKIEIVRQGVIPSLIELSRVVNTRAQRNASGCILNLTHVAYNRDELVAAGVIPVLIKLLTAENEDVQFYTAAALSNIAVDAKHRPVMVAYRDGLVFTNLMTTMKTSAEKVKCQACLAFRNLASDEENQQTIVKRGGLSVLLPLMSSQARDTASAAVAALRNLSIHEANATPIIEHGFLHKLNDMLSWKQHSEIQYHAAGTIRNLAAEEQTKQIIEHGTLNSLAEVLQDSAIVAEVVLNEATAALAILSSSSEVCKFLMDLLDGNVYKVLMQLILSSPYIEVQYNSAATFGHLVVYYSNCSDKLVQCHPSLNDVLHSLLMSKFESLQQAGLWIILQLSDAGLKSILTFHTTDLIAKLKQSSNSSDIQNLVRAAMKALQRT